MAKSMIDPKILSKASKTLKALAHPDRLKIIEELRFKERSVGELVAKLQVPQAVVSKHLIRLKKAGILASKTDHNFRYYSLANIKVLDVLNCIKTSCSKKS